MATFILTWNPDRWEWPSDEYQRAVRTTSSGNRHQDRWSVGIRSRGIAVGDHALLLRQRHDRGIVASGHFTSEVESGPHWDGSGHLTTYAQVEWDTIVDPEDRLPVEILNAQVPEVRWDRMQGSGVQLPASAAATVDQLWSSHAGAVLFHSPEELPAGAAFAEGAVTRAEVNRYERDPRARAACLSHWGPACAVCSLSFEDRYGSIGKGFIHVHHLRELSAVGSDYRVDPVNDLRPVCPNCHAMLHRRRPAFTVEELKTQLSLQGPLH